MTADNAPIGRSHIPASAVFIRAAEFPRDAAHVRELFREYAAGLGVDLSFQDFETELAQIPGKYGAPTGQILLACQHPGDALLGCVAMRPLSDDDCEMKRLFVRPAARGLQIGVRLVDAICAESRALGYRRICLDTLASMGAAVQLYQRLGFARIEPYTFNPLPGATFLALPLQQVTAG